MKAVIVILDGLADNKIAELGNKTTFDYAQHPHMDRVAAEGWTGYLDACPDGYTPESMVCILNILGIGKEHYPWSRASFEVLSKGYQLEEDEVVLQCNLAMIDQDNRLSSFNGGLLSKQQMKNAADMVSIADSEYKFLHLADYRNLIVFQKQDFRSLDIKTFPPHEHIGTNIDKLLSEIFCSSDKAQNFVRQTTQVLQSFGNDTHRYIFYPGGISQKNNLPSFE